MNNNSEIKLDSPEIEGDISPEVEFSSYARIPGVKLTNILSPDPHIVHYIQRFQEKALSSVSQFATGPAGLPHLAEWLKYYQSRGNSANLIIQNLLDTRAKNRPEPGIILYPMFPSSLKASELSIKLVTGIPVLLENDVRDRFSVESQIDGLRKINEPLLIEFIKQRGESPRVFENLPGDSRFESAPRLWIEEQDDSRLPDWRRLLSLENELINQANAILNEYEIDPYHFNLFRKDLLYVGLSISKTVKELVSTGEDGSLIKHGLYLAKNEIGEVEHDEIRFAWVILSDLFETKLKKLIDAFGKSGKIETLLQLSQTLQNPELTAPEGVRKFSVTRIVKIVEASAETLNKLLNAESDELRQWAEYLIDVAQTLKALSVELAKKLQKESLKIVCERIIELTQEIKSRSRGEDVEAKGPSLTRLSVESLFSEGVFEEPSEAADSSAKVLDALEQDPCLASCKYNNFHFFADVDYLFLIQTNYQNKFESEKIRVAKRLKSKISPEINEQINAVNRIIGALPQTHPHIDDYQSLLRRKDPFSFNIANKKLMLADSIKKKRERVERRVAMLNEYAGLGAFVAIGVVLSFLIQTGLNIYGLFSFRSIVINALVLAGCLWLIRFLFGEKLVNKEKKAIYDEYLPTDESAEREKLSSAERLARENKNEIARIATEYVFPPRFDKINEHILTPPTLDYTIKLNLYPIREKIAKLKDADEKKAIATIRNALAPSIVTLSYKNPPGDKPDQLIFLRNDFTKPAIRTLIADYFREEKGNTPPTDTALHHYYNYFIDQIERYYYRYVK